MNMPAKIAIGILAAASIWGILMFSGKVSTEKAAAPANTETTPSHQTQGTAFPPKIGGDKDANGCLVAAGYSWCQLKQKCLRIWEETCDSRVNFSEIGNLVNRGDELVLVYEEPGKPALQKTLVFEQASRCNKGTGEVSCMGISFENGDRAFVEGRAEEGRLTVILLRLEDPSFR
jgi:hypothetical protein